MTTSASPHPLRLALISEHASPLAVAGGVDAGGQNVYVSQVARCLADAGHHVDVLTRRDDPALPTMVHVRPRLRVLHIEAGPNAFVRKEDMLRHMPTFADQSRKLFEHLGPYDAIHANFFMSGWVGLALARRFGLPLVTTFHALGLVRREHQGADDGFPAERIEIERTLVRRSDRVIAECPQDQADLQRLYDAPADRIAMVPCGVAMTGAEDLRIDAARQRLGLPMDQFVVLQLGRLVPRKGIDNAIRAMAHLPRHLNARLYVVGGASEAADETVTPEIGRLRAVAAQAGAAERVQFVGRRDRDQLRDWYVAADVFVTTPWYEPFGITPLEAMACGTPVIGSAVGGIQYSVRDGVTGFLVPPHDPAALATRLSQLQRSPALIDAFGRAGIARVRAQFTWERVAHDLAAVYESVRGRALAQRRARLSLVGKDTPAPAAPRAAAWRPWQSARPQ
jgi:D-inositol-3-phosphate glycosyltransferase